MTVTKCKPPCFTFPHFPRIFHTSLLSHRKIKIFANWKIIRLATNTLISFYKRWGVEIKGCILKFLKEEEKGGHAHDPFLTDVCSGKQSAL